MDPLFNSTSLFQVTCTDPDEFLEKAVGWDIEHYQLAPGAYRISMDILHTKNIQISNVSHHVGILERGYIPNDACAISLPTLLSSKPLHYRGGILEKDQCPALLSGEEFETFSSGGVNYVTLVVETALLDKVSRLVRGQDFSSLVQQQRVYISRQSQQWLRQSIATFMNFQNISPGAPGGGQQSLLETQLLEQLLLAIQPPPGKIPKFPNRIVVARQAKQDIQDHLQQQLSIEQICDHIGCSMRTLHLGFKECYGTTPRQYARTLALNAVHRQLGRLSPNETIADIAMRWGFYHLGRFSHQYKTLFCELPSETVKRYRESSPDFSGVVTTAV